MRRSFTGVTFAPGLGVQTWIRGRRVKNDSNRECDHADCGKTCGYGTCGDCPVCGSLSPWRCGCLDKDGNPIEDDE